LFKNRILKFKPAAVTIFSGYNDWEDYTSGIYGKNDPFTHCLSHVLPTNHMERVLDYSALAHTAKKAVYKFRDKNKLVSEEAMGDIKGWTEQWKNNIGEIIELCNENGIQCFVIGQLAPVYDNASTKAKSMAIMDLDFQDNFDEYLKFVKLMNRTCKELCEEKRAVFVDVARDFEDYFPVYLMDKNSKERYSLFADCIHFTEQGNLIMGLLIYNTLSRHL